MKTALPEIYQNNGPCPIVIWSAACSIGDEAYSLAMIALEFMKQHSDADIKIMATDINAERIMQAQTGFFYYYEGIRGNKISQIETVLFKDPPLTWLGNIVALFQTPIISENI